MHKEAKFEQSFYCGTSCLSCQCCWSVTADGSMCNASSLKITENLSVCVCVWQVHPNAERSPHLRLKMYEFAGRVVGKCLYESALGGAYKQLVRARFTRSFLAQIIGLRMNYKVVTTQQLFKTKCIVFNMGPSNLVQHFLISLANSQRRYGRCFA